MGLASGFVEPLESTAIHIIQVSIQRLILLFPHAGDFEERRREFNRISIAEYEYIRDFIILHYYANNRVGDPFWDACRNMSIPDSLRHKMELFRETAGIFCPSEDLFQLTSWLQVSARAQYTDAKSDVTVFDYDRWIAGGYLTATWGHTL